MWHHSYVPYVLTPLPVRRKPKRSPLQASLKIPPQTPVPENP